MGCINKWKKSTEKKKIENIRNWKDLAKDSKDWFNIVTLVLGWGTWKQTLRYTFPCRKFECVLGGKKNSTGQ